MHKWTQAEYGWQPSPFGDFERLGGGLASEPVVLQQASGQLEVFRRGTSNELSALVEQTLRALRALVPKARGPVSAGLLHLAAQYADLAGRRRVQRSQAGSG